MWKSPKVRVGFLKAGQTQQATRTRKNENKHACCAIAAGFGTALVEVLLVCISVLGARVGAKKKLTHVIHSHTIWSSECVIFLLDLEWRRPLLSLLQNDCYLFLPF